MRIGQFSLWLRNTRSVFGVCGYQTDPRSKPEAHKPGRSKMETVSLPDPGSFGPEDQQIFENARGWFGTDQ